MNSRVTLSVLPLPPPILSMRGWLVARLFLKEQVGTGMSLVFPRHIAGMSLIGEGAHIVPRLTKGTGLAALAALMCSAFWPSSRALALCQNETSCEYTTEVRIEEGLLEEPGDPEKAVVSDNPDEANAESVERKGRIASDGENDLFARKNEDVFSFQKNVVDAQTLEHERKKFQTIVRQGKVPLLQRRYAGFLWQERAKERYLAAGNRSRWDDPSLQVFKSTASEDFSFSPGKTYSVDQFGKIVEVPAVDMAPSVSWSVAQSPRNGAAKAKERQASAKQAQPKVVVSAFAGTRSQGERQEYWKLNTSASLGAFQFNAGDVLPPLRSAGKAAQGDVDSARRASVRGRVLVPEGMKAQDVILRIAGTDLQISPDTDGFFEFTELPAGSQFEIVVWDQGGQLNRRIIPVVAEFSGREYSIRLETAGFIDRVSEAFGMRQDMMASGFCGKLSAKVPALTMGAQVRIVAANQSYQPYFYNARGLPDASLAEATEDGRFCAFNVHGELAEVMVQLTNGERRQFSVHLKPSTFEVAMDFDLVSTIYRPVLALELLDSQESLAASSRQRTIRFGSVGNHSWLDGASSAMWAPVEGGMVSGARAYGPVSLEGKVSEPVYFATGEAFNEVAWTAGSGRLSAFSLMSAEKIASEKIKASLAKTGGVGVFQERSKPLALKVLDSETVAEFDRASGHALAGDFGTAFVSLDLAFLGVEYNDVRLSVRDVWTGTQVGEFHFLPVAKDSRSPRFVRAFVGKLPEGQYSFVVSDKSGALRWLDTIRARPGGLQVVAAEP